MQKNSFCRESIFPSILMRRLLFLILLLATGLAYGQVTNNPYVEERYSRRSSIVRVELTDEYTIIDMRYGLSGQMGMFNPFGRTNTIQIDPQSRLYRPRDTSRKYLFVKAEGIPVSPEFRKLLPGETVNFRLYYERLAPGIEVFDLYEGRNPDPAMGEPLDNHEFWNFYGIHIKNPLPPNDAPRKNPPPPVLAEKPVPRPKPKPQPAEPPRQKTPDVTAVPEEKPAPPAFVGLTGTVFDAKTQQPLTARLRYAEQGDSVQIGTSSGRYRLGLNSQSKYSLRVSAPGYLSTSLNVSPADSAGKIALQHDFYLVPLVEGTSVALDNIYFATSKFALLPESFSELDNLTAILKENPNLRIRIEGHTDKVGDFDKNVELSRNRANAVRDYLIKQGIAPVRLEAQGYGSTRLKSKGTSEAERMKNRRVEFVILGT